MKIIEIKSCEECPKTTHRYNQNQDMLMGYCGELKGKGSKIPNGAKIHPDCPLEDYNDPKNQGHNVSEYYKECGCEPFQSCEKCAK